MKTDQNNNKYQLTHCCGAYHNIAEDGDIAYCRPVEYSNPIYNDISCYTMEDLPLCDDCIAIYKSVNRHFSKRKLSD